MNQVFTKILLATDGSKDARLAARTAVDLAARSNAELHVAHVWNYTSMVVYPYSALPPDYPNIVEDDGRAILADECRRILADGGKITQQHLLQGDPGEEIVELSQRIGADLIVTGSRGHEAFGRLVLGSVSDEIVRRATCPVLVSRGISTAWPPTRLIVGTDGSDEAENASEVAAAVAALLGASVLLIRVLPKLPASAKIDLNIRNEMLGRLNDILACRAKALGDTYGARVEILATIGNPSRVLVELADIDPESALLAIGKRGLSRIDRWRLGSVSNDVLHASQGPVLIVPLRMG
jgi:nucleotide-binding universal stress UspA family protein